MPVEERDAELRAMEEHTKHWEERAVGDREQLQELLEWVDERLADPPVGGFVGSNPNDPKPGLELVADRIRDEQKAGS